MHGKGMIHGDLKGAGVQKLASLFCLLTRFSKANILIDQDCHARLADFGLLTIISDHTNFTASNSTTNAGTTRWMSPELLNPEQFDLEKCQRTKESDCYALGMVVLEVLSGQPPFPRDANHTVILKVTKGDRPARPQGAEGAWFTDDLWEILELCWSPWPRSRPTVEVVHDCLERVSIAWRPLPLSVGGNAEADTSDKLSFATGGPGTFPHPIVNPSLTFEVKVSGFRKRPPQLSTPGIFTAGSTDARKDSVQPDRTKLSRPLSRRTSVRLDNGDFTDRSEDEGDDGAPPTMSNAEAKKRITEDIKELFSIHSVSKPEGYFIKIPSEHHHLLVKKLVNAAIESGEADGMLSADAFTRAAEKQLCSISAFEEEFLPTAELLGIVAIDALKAFQIVATMVKGAGLDKDGERPTRIVQESMDSGEVLQLLS